MSALHYYYYYLHYCDDEIHSNTYDSLIFKIQYSTILKNKPYMLSQHY